MSTIRTSNNPAMLVWAREEVGYTLEQASEAIGVSLENLKAAESGDRSLTLNQLRTAAEMYDFPFGYFYLSEPPHNKSFKPIPDFRVEPGLVGVNHYRLGLEIKKCRDRRTIFIDLAENMDIEINVFQVLQRTDHPNIGTFIRNRLNILDAQINSLNFDQVYSFWKEKIESDGVLVYESQYIPDASGVIGAAIFYEKCPVILIKRGGDFNERKLFTLLHEYAHLLMGQSAINDAGAQTIDLANSAESSLEVLCNRLAAEILVPSEKIISVDYRNLGAVEKMEHLARTYKVTYTTAAVCLKRLNLISLNDFIHLLELRRAANQVKPANKGEGVRIPRENLMRLDMGRPMFNTVLGAYSAGILDVFDTSAILNLRVKKIDKLASGLRQ